MEGLFSISYFISVFPRLFKAMPQTMLVVLGALGMGLVFAFLATKARLYGHLRGRIAGFYISFMRGVPLIALLFLIYFGVPEILGWFDIDYPRALQTFLVILGFALNVSGYLAENMRSAYLAVDVGQFEAADSIGMTPFQRFIYVIFPQALVVSIPNIGNTVVMLIKDTSLAFTFGILDIMGRAVILNTRSYGARQVEIYLAAGLLYWAVCLVLERLIRLIEKRAERSRFRTEKGGVSQ